MNSFQFIAFLFLVSFFGSSTAQLSATFYDITCPNISSVARGVLEQARQSNSRIGAFLIRLHFHDCINSGCDASLLLDAADGIDSEKDETQNLSIAGYEVLDDIKTALENVCPGIVSCADIVALASQIVVSLDGGRSTPWEVQFGRRDSTTAFPDGVGAIPDPRDSLDVIRQKYSDVGLDSTDIVASSGAHTFGKAGCLTFDYRLNESNPDLTMDATYRQELRQVCPAGGDGRTVVDLDPTTPNGFDNNYFTNLQNNRGLLESDQILFSTAGSDTVELVNRFAESESDFFDSFGQTMINIGNIRPLTGNNGQIRTDCRRVN